MPFFRQQSIAVVNSLCQSYTERFIIEAKTIFFYDYKSTIKEYGDAEDVEVTYELIEEHGAPHDKTFVMRILIDGVDYGHGVGKSKKDAEQLAACKAIDRLKLDK